jgi:hypothetical protein
VARRSRSPTSSPRRSRRPLPPETQKHFAAEGAEVVQKTPAEFAAFIEAELGKWQRVVNEAKIKAE